MSQARELADVASGNTTERILSGRKNLIINGGFDVWQRGTYFSPTSGGQYFADRWFLGTTGSSGLVRRVTNQHTLVSGAGNGIGININGASSVQFVTNLENPEKMHNKTFTLSFYVKGAEATQFNYVGVIFKDGVNTDLLRLSGAKAISTSYNRVSFTFDVGDLSSLDMAQTNRKAVVVFRIPDGLTTEIFLTNIQLEEGSQATDFEYRSYGEELALCQRYYYKKEGYSTYASTIALAQDYRLLNYYLPVPLRAQGSVTIDALAGSYVVMPTVIDMVNNVIMFQWNNVPSNLFTGVIQFSVDAEL